MCPGSSVGRALAFGRQGYGFDPGHHQLSVAPRLQSCVKCWLLMLGCLDRENDQMVEDEERTMLELREEIRKAAREIKKVLRSIRR